MHRKRIIVSIIALVMLVIIIFAIKLRFFNPIEALSCIANGGDYRRTGPGRFSRVCVYKYADAGKICNNSSECLGGCTVESYGYPYKKYVGSGICEEDNNSGCTITIEDARFGNPIICD